MIKRLTADLKAEGFKYRRSFRSALLTRNLSRRYDMIIYDDKRLYAVKLWSSYFAYNHLVVTKSAPGVTFDAGVVLMETAQAVEAVLEQAVRQGGAASTLYFDNIRGTLK